MHRRRHEPMSGGREGFSKKLNCNFVSASSEITYFKTNVCIFNGLNSVEFVFHDFFFSYPFRPNPVIVFNRNENSEFVNKTYGAQQFHGQDYAVRAADSLQSCFLVIILANVQCE